MRVEKQSYQEELRRTICNNLNELLVRKGDRKKAADACHISHSSISKWLNLEDGTMPGPEYIKILADTLGTSTDWIMSDHKEKSIFCRQNTYFEAFQILTTMVENRAIKPEHIDDPILRYLVNKGQEIFKRRLLDDTQKQTWLSRVMELFDLPLQRGR